jgi:YggT family protein
MLSAFTALFSGILQLLEILLTLYIWMIVARAILSWVNPYARHPIVSVLIRLTDPLLWKIRRWIPMPRMGLDFSPIFAILAIMLLRYILFVIRTEMTLRF